jgi:hypothetical protein
MGFCRSGACFRLAALPDNNRFSTTQAPQSLEELSAVFDAFHIKPDNACVAIFGHVFQKIRAIKHSAIAKADGLADAYSVSRSDNTENRGMRTTLGDKTYGASSTMLLQLTVPQSDFGIIYTNAIWPYQIQSRFPSEFTNNLLKSDPLLTACLRKSRSKET